MGAGGGTSSWTLIPSGVVGLFLGSFKEYPPSQVSGTTSVERALQAIQAGSKGDLTCGVHN